MAVLAGLAGGLVHAVNAADGRTVSPSFWLMQLTAAIGYGTLAWVLRSRGTVALRAAVGTVALCPAFALLANEVALAAGSSLLTWVGSWLWAPGYVAIVALLPALLPDGHPVSPRWRPGVALGVVAAVLAGASWAVTPYDLQDYPGPLADSTNPVGTDLATHPLVAGAVAAVLLSAVAVAAASLVVRWRGSRGVVRQQLKWVLLGVAATIVVIVVSRLVPVGAVETVAALAMLPLPAAIGVAVLRHGLWDVEVVVSRSVGYAAVSVSVVGRVPGGGRAGRSRGRPGPVGAVGRGSGAGRAAGRAGARAVATSGEPLDPRRRGRAAGRAGTGRPHAGGSLGPGGAWSTGCCRRCSTGCGWRCGPGGWSSGWTTAPSCGTGRSPARPTAGRSLSCRCATGARTSASCRWRGRAASGGPSCTCWTGWRPRPRSPCTPCSSPARRSAPGSWS